MHRIWAFFRNPVIPVLLIVAILTIGWYRYTNAESQLNQSTANIMPNAGLDELDSSGKPAGWKFTPANSRVSTASETGYQSPLQFVITSPGSSSDSSELTSPSVAVTPGTTYLYKAFYRSSVPFDLIMQSTQHDGTSKRSIVRSYSTSQQWTTASYLFKADPSMQSVAFMYRMSGAGEFRVDNTYLEANPTDVTPPPEVVAGINMFPPITDQSATGWQSSSYGELQAIGSLATDDVAPYLRLQVADYKNGEASWREGGRHVHGNQAFQFSVSYKSTALSTIVADYTLTSGAHTYSTVSTLQPASEWTASTTTVEAPSDATDVTFSSVLQSNGVLDTRDYSLIDISKPGVQAWKRPLLSITFDDGWESAYKNAVPLLVQYGYTATFYITPSALDTESFMSSDDVTNLAKAGQELASHGYEHLDMTTLSVSQLDSQLSRAADYFRQIRHQQTMQFATPFGTSDAQVEYAARKYYPSLRTTDDGINTLQNFNPYHLVVLYVGSDTPSSKIAATIADAQAIHGWLILVYHRVDTNTQGEPVVTPVQFHSQLDVIKQSHISVVPVGAALHELTAQQGP